MAAATSSWEYGSPKRHQAAIDQFVAAGGALGHSFHGDRADKESRTGVEYQYNLIPRVAVGFDLQIGKEAGGVQGAQGLADFLPVQRFAAVLLDQAGQALPGAVVLNSSQLNTLHDRAGILAEGGQVTPWFRGRGSRGAGRSLRGDGREGLLLRA